MQKYRPFDRYFQELRKIDRILFSFFLFFLRHQRQGDKKRTAVGPCTFCPYFPLVNVDNLFGNRQPKPATGILFVKSRRIMFVIAFKDLFQMLRRNADAGIGQTDDRMRSAIYLPVTQRQRDGVTLWCEFQRIG